MDNKKGLYGKYIITKADGTPVNDRCFILKPEKDPAAVKALQAYAAATEDTQLRHELYAWVGAPDVVIKHGDKAIMTDREKLVHILKEYPYIYSTAEQLADYLIANGVIVRKWISAQKKQPKKWRYVLAMNADDTEPSEPCIAYMNDSGWVTCGIIGSKVTHWMPLRELPKEAEE